MPSCLERGRRIRRNPAEKNCRRAPHARANAVRQIVSDVRRECSIGGTEGYIVEKRNRKNAEQGCGFAWAACILYALGAAWYAVLLGQSLRYTMFRIVETETGYATETGVFGVKSMPYGIALFMLVLILLGQITALFRRTHESIAAASLTAALTLCLPLFADVTLAEFTLSGLTAPWTLVKFLPLFASAVLWMVYERKRTKKG